MQSSFNVSLLVESFSFPQKKSVSISHITENKFEIKGAEHA